MSDVKRILKNTTVLFAGDVIGRILSFFLIIAIAQYLGDTGLGKYSFIFAFVGVFEIFSDFGVSTFISREIARDKSKTANYFHNVASIKLILAIVVLLIPIAFIYFIDNSPEIILSIIIASFAMFFYYAREFIGILFQAHEKLEYYSAANVLERFVAVAIGSTVLYLGLGIVALTSAFLISYTLSFIFITVFLLRNITHVSFRFDTRLWRRIFKESLPFWLTGVFILIYFRIDTLMLGIMQDYSVVGWYNAAYKFLDALYFIPGAVVFALYPAMSRYSVAQHDALQLLFSRAFYYLSVIAIPIGIGTTLLADRIIFFIYGTSFTNSALALQILIWAEVFIFLSSLTGFLLNSINKQAMFTTATAFSAFLNIALNLYAIPRFSYIGASVTTVLTEFLMLSLLLIFALRSGYSVSIPKTIIKPVVAAFAMGVAVWYLSFLHIIVLVIIGTFVYSLVLYLIRGIGKQEIDLVRQLISRKST